MSKIAHIRGRALAYGQDPTLLQTRAKLLIADGYETDLAGNLAEVHRLLMSETMYDIVVICHSVTAADQEEVRTELKLRKQYFPLYSLKAAIPPTDFLMEVGHLTGKETKLSQR